MDAEVDLAPDDAAGAGEEIRYRVPALERGLDIIELLSVAEAGMSRADLAQAMGCSVSQIFRMLDCLQRRKFINLNPRDNRFGLTSKLFEIAHRHPPTSRLTGLALPILRAAAASTRQSIHLSIFDDGQTLVLVQETLEDSGYFVKPGTRRDVYLTASGRVLLAFQPHKEREAMLVGARAATGELMPVAELERRLDVIRLQGFEEMPSLQIAGVHNFSFPVLNVSGRAIAAMTMPFLVRSDIVSNLDEARNTLRAAALELSQQLGYAPESTIA
jgi:DNA-binding IclR family transcriptional regulator